MSEGSMSDYCYYRQTLHQEEKMTYTQTAKSIVTKLIPCTVLWAGEYYTQLRPTVSRLILTPT